MKFKQVAEELGVRYVLEGSVRKAGDEIRINAQLIDAMTGHHLWAERRYDGKMDRIFALQDQITQKIVSAMQVQLTGGEKEQVGLRATDNIEAYKARLERVTFIGTRPMVLRRQLPFSRKPSSWTQTMGRHMQP